MVKPQRPIDYTGPIVRARLRASARPVFLALVCAAGLSVSDHASARDYASRAIGGWMVSASKDGKGCFLTRTYERPGGTTLLLGLDIDGTNRLSVLNANWSIKPKDRLKLNFRLSNSSYPAHFAVGMVSEGKQGFVTSFGAKFPSYFAASKALHISRGDVPVERLDLDGSSAAVAELRNCVEDQRVKPAAARGEGQRLDHIPKDPFGPAQKRKSGR
ncbi:MAG TPA: hypothetical protein VNZ43_15310 [Sphingomonadaceae bacterium]|nr:hypothetical protein [Sphingomonadaceae bacterium]